MTGLVSGAETCISPATAGHTDLGTDNAIDVARRNEVILLNNFLAFSSVIAGWR